MCKKLKLLLISIWLISFASLAAQNENAGSTGFETLKIFYNARTIAMGGAVNGIAQNADGLDFNPAVILNASGKSVSSSFIDHLVGSAGGSVNWVYPKNPFVAWGAGLRYWNSGGIERTYISPTGELIETGEKFSAQSLVASASHARFISPALDLGLTAKLIYDQIDDANASAGMIDIGILHHTVNERIKVGVGVRNLGFQLSHYSSEKHKENLPATYGAGISIRMSEKILGAIDVSKATGENLILRLGVEHDLNPALTLRGGFKSNAGD